MRHAKEEEPQTPIRRSADASAMKAPASTRLFDDQGRLDAMVEEFPRA